MEYIVKHDGTPIARDPEAENAIRSHVYDHNYAIRIKNGKIENASRLPLGLIESVLEKIRPIEASMPCIHQLGE